MYHSGSNKQVWFIYVRNCGMYDSVTDTGCCKSWFTIKKDPMTWAEVIAEVATMSDAHCEHVIVHMSFRWKYQGDN